MKPECFIFFRAAFTYAISLLLEYLFLAPFVVLLEISSKKPPRRFFCHSLTLAPDGHAFLSNPCHSVLNLLLHFCWTALFGVPSVNRLVTWLIIPPKVLEALCILGCYQLLFHLYSSLVLGEGVKDLFSHF